MRPFKTSDCPLLLLSCALVTLPWTASATGRSSAVASGPQELASASELPPLVLGQGEQRLVRAPGLKRYSLGGPSVRAHVLDAEQAILIKAVAPGTSDLWVWKADGRSEHRTLRVERVAPSDLPRELEKALGHLEQTEVLIAGPGAILRGQVHDLKESARIRALVLAFPKNVHDETEPSDSFLKAAEARLIAWMRSNPKARTLKLERQGRTLFVRGSFDRPTLQAAAESEIRKLYPQAVVEIDSMPDASPTVYFRVFLLELKKTRFRNLGLSWPAGQEGAFRVTAGAIRDALALDVAINALEGDGSLRILSNPELVVRAPGDAELFAGGELPIRSKSRNFSGVTWKNYGLTLQLKVTQSSGERVRLEIFTEVSHLDTAISQDDIPGINSSRMKTQVDARYGEPLLLSGLLKQNLREQARGLPLLRNIPVLGKLFGSEDYLQERSELVAILLPASAPPSNPMARLTHHAPRGLAPPPRQWIPPEQERALRQSPEWPWNALR